MTEVKEKPDIETKISTAVTERALITDEPVTSLERDRKYQEATTEIEIGGTESC